MRAPLVSVLRRPLLRLPAVLFPGQAVSLSKKENLFHAPEEMLSCAWKEYEGRVASFADGCRIGVELHIMYDQALESTVPTPPDVAHAVAGQRVRLSRTVSGTRVQLCDAEVLPDEVLSARREERLADEAMAARRLLSEAEDRGVVTLESSVLDEELGGPVCDPRCHPLWPEGPPEALPELSLWLAARLPLSTDLRTHLLSTLCPLRRMQDVVDALRLILDPHRSRPQHKYKLITSHAANDAYCSTLGGSVQQPRLGAPPRALPCSAPSAHHDHGGSCMPKVTHADRYILAERHPEAVAPPHDRVHRFAAWQWWRLCRRAIRNGHRRTRFRTAEHLHTPRPTLMQCLLAREMLPC